MEGCFVGNISVSRKGRGTARSTSSRTSSRVVVMNLDLGFTEKDVKKLDEIAAKADETYDGPPPGKIKIDDIILAEQTKALNELSVKWKKERLTKEVEAAKLFGFTNRAEDLNCRFAMFGLLTGYLTELYTGDTIPQQMETLLRALGVI